MKNVLRCIRMRAHAASAIAPDSRTLENGVGAGA